MAKKSYFIHISLWHNSKTEHGIAQYHTADTAIWGNREEIIDKLSKWADNVNSLKIDKTINAITINTDDRWIMQYCGYSYNKGMYCKAL